LDKDYRNVIYKDYFVFKGLSSRKHLIGRALMFQNIFYGKKFLEKFILFTIDRPITVAMEI